MRPLRSAFLIACFVAASPGLGQEPADSKPKEETPVVAVSYDNWWWGKHAFSFYADGSFKFELHRKRFDSHVTGSGKLQPEQIEKLLAALKEKGFFGISKESIEKKIADEGGRKSYTTDQTTYRIVVHHADFKQQIEYYGVSADAEKFPKNADLQILKKSVGEIHQFLSDATAIR